jgi:hypothetical protein
MSFDMNKMVTITNRSAGLVIYSIPEHSITRTLQRGETRQVPYQEMVWLSYTPGGKQLMNDMLFIREADAVKELEIPAEVEYFLDEKGVENLLNNESLDALLDALDFAPEGVIQLIKDKAVAMPLNDMAKREAIKNVTGFDVTAAIDYSKPDEDEEKVEAPAAIRRVQKSAATSGRRVEAPVNKYEVVTPEE